MVEGTLMRFLRMTYSGLGHFMADHKPGRVFYL
jgi:hypothetical protein